MGHALSRCHAALCGSAGQPSGCPAALPRLAAARKLAGAWRERVALPPSLPGRMQTQGGSPWAVALTPCTHAMPSPLSCSQGPKRSFASNFDIHAWPESRT